MLAWWLQTYRLLLDVVEGRGVGVDNLALNLVGPSTVVSQAARGGHDITGGHGNGLSVVERLNGGKGLDLTLHQVGKLAEKLATVATGLVPPCAFKSFARGGDLSLISCNSNWCCCRCLGQTIQQYRHPSPWPRKRCR